MKELTDKEKAFVANYLNSFSARKAAIDAGYSKNVASNHAWAWVSITGCPTNKVHVRDVIHAEIDKIYGEENIDKGWILKRAKLLADFNIAKFIVQNDNGDAVYDFTNASYDDWYCIEEYVTETSFRAVSGGEPVAVNKVRLKAVSKLQALKILGDHVDVGAFRENVHITGQTTQVFMTAEKYKKARHEMLAEDDC